MAYITVILDASHNRKDFSCGKSMLDNYLHKQVSQDIKRKLSVCFVLPDAENEETIKGYYTLSNDTVPLEIIPEDIRKRMPPSYINLPTTLLGRLAVDSKFMKQGIGELLLLDALKRSYDYSKNIGSFAVIVDPLDMDAENFYLKYGFIKLPDSGKMFLLMATIAQIFKE